MHLKQPGFTHSACGPFTKNKERIEKIASDPKYDGYQRGLALMVYKIFDKKSALLNKSSGSGFANEPNYQLANELDKPINRKF